MRSARLTVLVVSLLVAACGGDGDTGGTGEMPLSPSPSELATTTQPEATTTQATLPPTTSPPASAGTLEDPLPVGAVAVVGDWSLRVSAVTPDGTDQILAENQFNEPPSDGQQFFISTLEATYNGSESGNFWLDVSLKAVGASAVAYESLNADCGVIPDSITDAGETFPGGTITGNTCWAIDTADANSLVMIAEPTFSFDDERAFLSLDPDAEPLDASTGSGTIPAVPEETTPIGEAAMVGDWSLRVSAVTPDGTEQVLAENEFNDPPSEGKQFFLATLEATYNGSESGTFWIDVSLKALGASAVAYESLNADCGVIPDSITDPGETFPGGTITGNTCWAIDASDADSLVMIAEPSFSFDDEGRTYFSLTGRQP